MFIDGKWCEADSGRTLGVINPATEEVDRRDGLRQPGRDRAGPSKPPHKAMPAWMKLTACDRAKVLKKTADLMRERADAIARTLTMEQGKPLAEAKARSSALGRHLRVVRRGRQARLRPGHPQLAAGQAARDASSIRSASSAPSARGTSRSRCKRARSPRPWPPAARSSASRPARRRCA